MSKVRTVFPFNPAKPALRAGFAGLAVVPRFVQHNRI
jgi:hypothetical protein